MSKEATATKKTKRTKLKKELKALLERISAGENWRCTYYYVRRPIKYGVKTYVKIYMDDKEIHTRQENMWALYELEMIEDNNRMINITQKGRDVLSILL